MQVVADRSGRMGGGPASGPPHLGLGGLKGDQLSHGWDGTISDQSGVAAGWPCAQSQRSRYPPYRRPPLTLGQVAGVRAQPGRSARGGAVFPGGALMAGTRPLQL